MEAINFDKTMKDLMSLKGSMSETMDSITKSEIVSKMTPTQREAINRANNTLKGGFENPEKTLEELTKILKDVSTNSK